jgi:phosphoglycerate dehydrogenase-like enzyme
VREPLRIALNYAVPADLVAEMKAIDPCIEILDMPVPERGFAIDWTPENRAAVERAMDEADILFGSLVRFPVELVRGAPKLKWYQTIAAGVDKLADNGLLDGRIIVTKGSGIASSQIAEHVVAMMLSLMKRLPSFAANQREHRWQMEETDEVAGSTLAIVGMGHIGRDVAVRVRPFGMRIVATRRRVAPGDTDPDCDELLPHDQLDAILPRADVVVLSMPLTPETQNLFDARRLALMKPTAYLINVARGGVLDHDALYRALAEKTIAGAGLDVTEPEPLPAESPLWDLPNVVITPHVSALVDDYPRRAAAHFVANLRRYVHGEPLHNLVDTTLGY